MNSTQGKSISVRCLRQFAQDTQTWQTISYQFTLASFLRCQITEFRILYKTATGVLLTYLLETKRRLDSYQEIQLPHANV